MVISRPDNAITNLAQQPVVAVSAAVFREGKVLLVQRATPPRGLWTLPGGRQNFGEALDEAAAREVREETALAIRHPRVCDAIDVFVTGEDGQASHFVIVTFACAWAEGELALSEELSRAAWFDVKEIERLQTTPHLARVVGNAARRMKEGSA